MEKKPIDSKKESAAKPAAKPAPAKAAAKPAVKKPAAEPKEAVKKPVPAAKPAAATKPAAKPAAKPAPVKAEAKPAAKKPEAKPEEKKPKIAAKESAPEKGAQADAPSEAPKSRFGEAIEVLKNPRSLIILGAAILLIVALVLGLVFGIRGLPLPPQPYYAVGNVTETFFTEAEIEDFNYESDKKNVTQVGYSGRVIGTVERDVPQTTRDERLPSGYPQFGYTLRGVIGMEADKVAARNALIAEANYLCATGTANAGGGGGYLWMDKDGFLYNGTVNEPEPATDSYGLHRRLYKHTAAVGMYMGDVAPDEPGIIKEVTMRPRGYSGYGVTGVYAPAGEVVKIQISEADMNATGGITIYIGQALYNGQANNIWTAKNQMQRFPVILNTMQVNKNTATLENGVYTAYVGSFLGGPLYIRNTNATFTATISGGVAYSHFILGYTSKAEFEKNARSSAPYFDLEVWNYGVLHSGPKMYARGFSYDDLYKAAILWEKVSLVTTTGSSQGIVFLYDPFVAAGAAVAFPGRRSVNCPAGWMSGSLNYDAIVTSGSWGNFHEYHHNFQGYGVGNGGEVTNNGMTLVSYSLFTKISAKRGIESYGASGLGGWNNYTSATWALNDLLSLQRGGHPSNGDQGLAIYATLLHNFGPDNYIQSKIRQQSIHYGENYTGYMRAWQDITHNDMTYFFKDVLGGITEEVAAEYRNPAYSTFVPVSCVYQTGRSYMYDGEKKYFDTMQPYVIPYGSEFTVDLSKYSAPNGQYASGSVVLPEGFEYRVKAITQPESGSIRTGEDGYTFIYTPGEAAFSGKIYVTLEITPPQGSNLVIDDVDLVLEFEQSHETNKFTLERTTYTYTADTMYSDVEEAYANNFAGYASVDRRDHSNPTQNSNTDVWLVPDTDKGHEDFPNAEDFQIAKPNQIIEVKGKLYFEEAGKYRIYMRGRVNCAMYYSLDGGQTYQLGAKIKSGSGSGFYTNNPDTYFDVEVGERSWVYYKSAFITLTQTQSTIGYMGLGTAKWTEPMFTMTEDEEGNVHYFDYQGNEVTEEEANNAELIPPTSASYVTAYRSDYEFPSNNDFETDYFYKRTYGYTYSESYTDLNQSVVGDPQCPSNFPIENLFDGDLNTACSSPAVVSAENPWELTVDLGKSIEANRFVLTGRLNNGAANQNQTPNSITLYVGETLDEMREVMSFDNGTVSGITLQFNFEKSHFRYYRLVVRRTVQGRFAAIGNIEFSNNINGGKLLPPDDAACTYTGDWTAVTANSTFGHVYTGGNGAELSFTFEGTRFAVLSSAAYGKSFEVFVDGNRVESIELKEGGGATVPAFISDTLAEGSHRAVIRCTGEASIDSIAVFD